MCCPGALCPDWNWRCVVLERRRMRCCSCMLCFLYQWSTAHLVFVPCAMRFIISRRTAQYLAESFNECAVFTPNPCKLLVVSCYCWRLDRTAQSVLDCLAAGWRHRSIVFPHRGGGLSSYVYCIVRLRCVPRIVTVANSIWFWRRVASRDASSANAMARHANPSTEGV
ncbi:hypothetical protein BV20DRAFT_872375 [Pilatotrama ljubarskyi]|nr:hypothetical protein BV20DRAFT_872375 [Pilatotrama ljubarskyi]